MKSVTLKIQSIIKQILIVQKEMVAMTGKKIFIRNLDRGKPQKLLE